MSRCIGHWTRVAAAMLLAVLTAAGCSGAANGPGATPETFIGTLEYIELEGGFWALHADSGQRYVLIGSGDQVDDGDDGRRVVVEGVPRPDRNSIYMWGTPLEVETVTSAPPGQSG